MTIEELQKLKEQFEVSQAQMEEIVYNYVRDCVKGDGGCADGVTFEDNHIVGRWSVSWRYGGYDEGYTYVPFEYVLDPEGFVENLKTKEEAEKVKKERKTEQEKRAKDLKELAKLKAKYPDA